MLVKSHDRSILTATYFVSHWDKCQSFSAFTFQIVSNTFYKPSFNTQTPLIFDNITVMIILDLFVFFQAIMIELYKKNIWNDAKTVNVIATACFSRFTKVSYELSFVKVKLISVEKNNLKISENTKMVFCPSCPVSCEWYIFKKTEWNKNITFFIPTINS